MYSMRCRVLGSYAVSTLLCLQMYSSIMREICLLVSNSRALTANPNSSSSFVLYAILLAFVLHILTRGFYLFLVEFVVD